MRKPSIRLSKIKNFFQEILHSAAERPLFSFVIFLILISFLGAFLFYKNVILMKNIQPEIFEKTIQLDEKPLENVLKEIDLRQKKFEESDKKQYPNFFGSPITPPETTPSGALTE
jgi:hydroxymethylpyrimidine pyrophosphatase-like HAD family hydrolase